MNALDRKRKQQQRAKDAFDTNVSHETFQPGDLVFVNVANPLKFRPKRYGPVLVSAVHHTPHTYQLTELNGSPFAAPYHADYLTRVLVNDLHDYDDILRKGVLWADSQYRKQKTGIADSSQPVVTETPQK